MSAKTWLEMTPEERAADWREKFPNAKHPMCEWCELPHAPLPPGANGAPDSNYCEMLNDRVNAEDFAALGKRFEQMLEFVGYHEFGDRIGQEVFQSDWWRLLMTEHDTSDWERGPTGTELLKRLRRIRRELIIARALCAQMSKDFLGSAAEEEARLSARKP